MAFDKKNIHPKDAAYLKKELEELSAMCQR
jgi:hypothetical protein